MKRIGVTILILLLLAVIAGCTLFQGSSPLHVAVVTKYSHPVDTLGGFPVLLKVDGGNGNYQVDWGDGTNSTALSHVYLPPIQSEYTITVTSGGLVKTAQVHVINNPPVVYPPFLTPSNPGWRGKILVDLRYRVHGCKKRGIPTSVSGIYDPDGDYVSLVIHITTGGKEDTVFNENRQAINGKNIPVGVYYWFPGWSDPNPPYPFSPQSLLVGSQVQTESATIQITATDEWGAKTTAEFVKPVALTSCTGGKKQ